MPIDPVAPATPPLRSHLLLSVLVASSLAAACGPRQAAAPPPPSADAWAVVDGREIKAADVEKAFRRTSQAAPGPTRRRSTPS